MTVAAVVFVVPLVLMFVVLQVRPELVYSLASPEQGTWFAVIHWMSKSSTSVDKALEYAERRSNNRQIVVLDTDQYKLRGGQSGQWAVGVQGLASMNEASAACRAMGLTPGSQCGRFQVS